MANQEARVVAKVLRARLREILGDEQLVHRLIDVTTALETYGGYGDEGTAREDPPSRIPEAPGLPGALARNLGQLLIGNPDSVEVTGVDFARGYIERSEYEVLGYVIEFTGYFRLAVEAGTARIYLRILYYCTDSHFEYRSPLVEGQVFGITP